MDPILLQKQLRDNASDLQDFCKDLKSWGSEMKQKEDGLKPKKIEKVSITSKSDINKSTTEKTKIKAVKAQKKVVTDYAKWDKFDVDAECEKVDNDIEEDSELTDECDESMRDEALVEKEKGNKYVKVQKWDEAIKCYTKAIDLYSYDPIFYANRALCYLRRGDVTKAETDCDLSLKLDKTYVKAYQRRAASREAQNKLYEAKQDLLTVLRHEPNNQESKMALDILKTKMGEYVKPPDLSIQRPVSKFTASRKNTLPQPDLTTPKTPNSHTVDTTENTSIWPKGEDIVLVKAINKPPHLRSKKPLKRVKIVEKDVVTPAKEKNNIEEAFKKDVFERKEIDPMDSKDTKPVSKFKKNQSKNKILEIPNTALPKANDNNNIISSDDFKVVEKQNPLTKTDKNITNKNLINTNKKTPEDVVMVAPKTSVQFHLTWDNLKSPSFKYEYLKLIDPLSMPKIFDEQLESDDITSILEVMSKYFVENKDPVYDFLKGLTSCERFIIMSLFMTDSDKNNVRKLISYSAQHENLRNDIIEDLYNKFSLVP
ncbi:unnamed protein product [Brassicogethes aeneus]|uniref:RNA polymerase II-associated protein 3 n=1 Tax=Brassicogethes aeneus TaxID=1431903 RepID=A0A9P0AY36_BRAAE|nr:unnamed protein product [Brassicogethes aeneus]